MEYFDQPYHCFKHKNRCWWGSNDTFTSEVTGLLPSTTYYLRAYATNSTGTGYGNEISFTTLAPLALATPVTDIDGNVYQTVAIGN